MAYTVLVAAIKSQRALDETLEWLSTAADRAHAQPYISRVLEKLYECVVREPPSPRLGHFINRCVCRAHLIWKGGRTVAERAAADWQLQSEEQKLAYIQGLLDRTGQATILRHVDGMLGRLCYTLELGPTGHVVTGTLLQHVPLGRVDQGRRGVEFIVEGVEATEQLLQVMNAPAGKDWLENEWHER